MTKPRISIIAAIGTNNRALGKNNQLLWRIGEDLKRFKALTTGHPIIMGRKTFESIRRALPNRTNIVITRNKDFFAEGIISCNSFEDALKIAKEKEAEEIFIIGGGEIYKQTLPYTDRLYLTLIQSNIEGDTFFPEYLDFKKEIERSEHHSEKIPYTFLTLEK